MIRDLKEKKKGQGFGTPEKFDTVSKTTPNEAYSIKQILEKRKQGLNLAIERQGQYDEEIFGSEVNPLRKIKDFTDLDEIKHNLDEHSKAIDDAKETLKKSKAQKKKAEEEAKIREDERKKMEEDLKKGSS